MNTIGTFFLRARHWQLFSLFMGLYMLGGVFGLAADSVASARSGGISPSLVVGETLWVLWMVCFMGWIASTGLFLNKLKGAPVRSKTGVFWFAVVYPTLFIVVFVSLFFSNSAPASPWIVVPPSLLATFCIFYAVYFAAKSMVMVDASRLLTLYDFAGPLFLILLFPLGIWFVQPRINRLYAQSKDAQAGAQPAALQ